MVIQVFRMFFIVNNFFHLGLENDQLQPDGGFQWCGLLHQIRKLDLQWYVLRFTATVFKNNQQIILDYSSN